MDKAQKRIIERSSRATRVRKKITGAPERPRLCVRRSLKHIFAQIIDDVNGKSLVQASSTAKEIQSQIAGLNESTKTDASRLVGEIIAQKAKEQGIENVVFDRKGYAYQGRVKALAEGARKSGLVF